MTQSTRPKDIGSFIQEKNTEYETLLKQIEEFNAAIEPFQNMNGDEVAGKRQALSRRLASLQGRGLGLNPKDPFYETLKRDCANVETQLYTLMHLNERISAKSTTEKRLDDFKNQTKEEIDGLLSSLKTNSNDNSVENSDIPSFLPEKICIGEYVDGFAFENYQLMRDLYGDHLPEMGNIGGQPITLDVRNCGNIIIKALPSDERNEILTRIICGLALKYLEEFPPGSLQLHFGDQCQNNMITNITTALNSGSTGIHIATKNTYIGNELKDLNDKYCDPVLGMIQRGIKDRYELYKVNPDLPCHLFVLRNGFSDLINGNSVDFQELSNLMHERGQVSGIRFIIVDDCEKTNDPRFSLQRKEHQLIEIYNHAMVFNFENDTLTMNGVKVSLDSIPKSSADKNISDRCAKIVTQITNRATKSVTYEDIGFGGGTNYEQYPKTIYIPVGKYGGTKTVSIPFSCGAGDGPVNIGLFVMGVPSTGKSNLFHALVINGCWKYSPDDLQYWLLDFKDGNTSGVYVDANLPHIQLVSKQNKPEDAVLLLKRLYDEMERRSDLLRSGNTIYTNLVEYNEYVDNNPDCGKPHLSRILVIIDEVQNIFSSDINNEESKNLLKTIVEQSRYCGIHLVLISQSPCSPLPAIFISKISAKITYTMGETSISNSGITEFGKYKSEIQVLEKGKGMAYYTMGDGQAYPINVAFSQNSDYLHSCIEKIRAKYNRQSNTQIIGDITPLLPSSTVQNGGEKGETYSALLETPSVIINENTEKGYVFTIGENYYKLDAQKITFSPNAGSLCILGSDTNLRSSLCTSLLMSAVRLKNKLIYVYNGVGEKQFRNAVSSVDDNAVKSYDDFGSFITDVYTLFKERKAKSKNTTPENINLFDENKPPVFIIIYDMQSIDDVIENKIIKMKADDVQKKTVNCGNIVPVAELKAEMNIGNAKIREDLTKDVENGVMQFLQNLSQRSEITNDSSASSARKPEKKTTLSLISEIRANGPKQGIYLIISSGSPVITWGNEGTSSISNGIKNILTGMSFKLLFNDIKSGDFGLILPNSGFTSSLEMPVTKFLFEFHKDIEMHNNVRQEIIKGETLALLIKNDRIEAKLRPIQHMNQNNFIQNL